MTTERMPDNLGPSAATHLPRFERELLETVGTGWSQPYGSREFTTPTVIAVWHSPHDGEVEVGRVRKRSTNNLGEYVEASPFPGAWSMVPVASLIRVVHPDVL